MYFKIVVPGYLCLLCKCQLWDEQQRTKLKKYNLQEVYLWAKIDRAHFMGDNEVANAI